MLRLPCDNAKPHCSNITMQTAEQVQKLYESNELLVDAITAQLESLKVKANDSDMLEESIQAAFISMYEKQEAMLQQQIQMCEDNRAVLEQSYVSQHFGDTKLGNHSRNFRGLDTDKAQGSLHQVFGRTEAGDGVWNFEGAASGSVISSFFGNVSGASNGVAAPGLFQGRHALSGASTEEFTPGGRNIEQRERMIMPSQTAGHGNSYVKGVVFMADLQDR